MASPEVASPEVASPEAPCRPRESIESLRRRDGGSTLRQLIAGCQPFGVVALSVAALVAVALSAALSAADSAADSALDSALDPARALPLLEALAARASARTLALLLTCSAASSCTFRYASAAKAASRRAPTSAWRAAAVLSAASMGARKRCCVKASMERGGSWAVGR